MSTQSTKRYLVTSALPYANGPLHFGHLGGVYIPADIYCRHRRLQGHEVVHVCGSDEHGVAIMLSAEKQNIPYKEYVNYWHNIHKNLFEKYDIQFDIFGQTSTAYHGKEVVIWFNALNKAGLIGKKSEKQLYSIDDQKFLPDRYVEGTCYVCGYEFARGDECPNCGEWIETIKLINPVSKISGSKNIEIREVEHYYLLLSKIEADFRKWFGDKNHWRNLVTGFVNGLLEQGLIDRAISRDLDWGINIPLDEACGKKFYVWFDAPIGYVSIFKEFLRLQIQNKNNDNNDKDDHNDDDDNNDNDELNELFNKWWKSDNVEISHFIGKDNIIFHSVIWPCMIIGSKQINLPSVVPANQFINLEGRQFSKSNNWYIDAQHAIDLLGVDALRFYLCSIIPENGDSNFSWNTFISVYNELANKVGNFIHRTLTFIQKSWPDGLPSQAFQNIESSYQYIKIEEYINNFQTECNEFHFLKAQLELFSLAQSGNEFFHSSAPWKEIKTNRQGAASSCAIAIIYMAAIGLLTAPITPNLSRRIFIHFQSLIKDDDISILYSQGLLFLIDKLKKDGFKLSSNIEVLVPRIEDSVMERLTQKLNP